MENSGGKKTILFGFVYLCTFRNSASNQADEYNDNEQTAFSVIRPTFFFSFFIVVSRFVKSLSAGYGETNQQDDEQIGDQKN